MTFVLQKGKTDKQVHASFALFWKKIINADLLCSGKLISLDDKVENLG